VRTLENGAAAHPKSARLVLLIGLMHEQSGAGGAERFYRKAVEVDADFANAHFRLANLLKSARGNDAGCVLHCSRVLELEDRDSRLARQAIELLSQCSRRGQDPAEEKSLNAGLLFHEGRSADAAKLYRDLADMGAPRPGVYYRLAEMAMDEAEWATVDAILAKAIREHPDNARLHYLVGEMWLRRDDAGKAGTAFRKAVALNDDLVPGLYRLTYLASQQGAPLEEILATATRVFELEEIDHPLARETLRIVEQTLTAAQ
jgi:tetratricopeptide (TPR) repeat protein